MSVLILAACLAAQMPSPQGWVPPPAAPQLTPAVALVAVPAPQPAAPPSVLVSRPPLWDRCLAHVGQALVDRAARHQHPQAMQLVAVQPSTFAAVPVPMLAPGTVAAPAPTPSGQSEAAPRPPSFAPRNDDLFNRLFRR